MRWIVYLLITANLIIGLWIYQDNGWSFDSEVPGQPAIGEIRVIDEEQLAARQKPETGFEPASSRQRLNHP